MIYVLYTLHILICFFLILVVLLQQGKGADLSVFGGGATQAAFGARGAATMLHKLTVAAFIGFIATTLGIGFMTSGETGTSVMAGVEPDQATQESSAPAEAPVTAEPPAADASDPGATTPGDGTAAPSATEGGAASAASPQPAQSAPAETTPGQGGGGADQDGDQAPAGAE